MDPPIPKCPTGAPRGRDALYSIRNNGATLVQTGNSWNKMCAVAPALEILQLKAELAEPEQEDTATGLQWLGPAIQW